MRSTGSTAFRAFRTRGAVPSAAGSSLKSNRATQVASILSAASWCTIAGSAVGSASSETTLGQRASAGVSVVPQVAAAAVEMMNAPPKVPAKARVATSGRHPSLISARAPGTSGDLRSVREVAEGVNPPQLHAPNHAGRGQVVQRVPHGTNLARERRWAGGWRG
jgi:hypothetical protein